jgi:hypothetical protein
MRYDEWCSRLGFGARLPGDTSPTPLERAKAKRARKASKRRRNAELTRLGQEASRRHALHVAWFIHEMHGEGPNPIAKDVSWWETRAIMQGIRRGEVTP